MRSKPIKVQKRELLSVLKNNFETHKKEYEEMMKVYLQDLEKSVDKLHQKVSENDPEFNPGSWSFPHKPKSYDNDYSVAIKMFEMEVEHNIELDETEFRKFICDEWDWQRSFAMSKTAYLK